MLLNSLQQENLIWFPELEIGYYPVIPCEYGKEYFEKYIGYETGMGEEITHARISLVKKYYTDSVVDVGIGSGQFVKAIDGLGYDVNPIAVHWLVENNKYIDIYSHKIEAACFWDSLEHIQEPDRALKQITDYVFVSIPIFRDVDHLLYSKHFRKDEHYWYFTHNGFINWMSEQGFSLIEYSNIETDLGREDIISYVYKRYTE